jgi:hypothetical protein
LSLLFKKVICFLLIFVTLTSIVSVNNIAHADSLSLSNKEKTELYEILRENIRSGKNNIDISKFNISRTEAESLINAFVWENPDISFCISGKSYKHAYGIIQSVEFSYDDSSTIIPRINYLNEEVTKIVAMINPDWTKLQKLLWINDYICDTFQYDLVTEYHSAVDLLKTGKGICEAYANLFTILCQRNDIEVSYCYSPEIQHIWNMVQLDGYWYHIDTTWNDTYTDKYEHFLLSDDECQAAIKKAGYTQNFTLNSLYKATSVKYDAAIWRDNVYSSIVSLSNDSYFIKDFSLYKINLSTLTYSQIGKVQSTKWTAPEGQYTAGFHDLEVIGNTLYYSTPNEVYIYSLLDRTSTSVYRTSQPIVSIRMTDLGLKVGTSNNLSNNVVNFHHNILENIYIVKYFLDNQLFFIQFYNKNDKINLPTNPRTHTIASINWDVDTNQTITKNIYVYGQSSTNTEQCIITFMVDGKVYETQTLTNGDLIREPREPEKESDSYNHYIFIEWVDYTPGSLATTNKTYHASFKEVKRNYTIKFYNDNTLIKEDKLEAGSSLSFPVVSQTISKDGKSYKFVGWSTTQTFALSNMDIYAVYAEENKTCRVIYYNNNQVFHEEVVPAGTRLTYTTEIPTMKGSGYTAYTFKGWTGQEEGSFILNDIVLTAEFEEVYLDTPIDTDKDDGLFANIDITFVIVVGVLILGILISWVVLFKKNDD